MHKLLLLRTISAKCADDGEGRKSELISFGVLAVLLVGIMGAGGYFAGEGMPIIAALLQIQDPMPSLFMIIYALGALAVLCFCTASLLRVMFLSSDIEVVATLPFTPLQIALVRMFSVFEKGLAISAVVILPFTLGLFISYGFNVMILICSLIAIITLPIGVLAVMGVLLTLLMSVIRVARNKDVLSLVGALLVVVAVVAYSFLQGPSSNADENKIAVLIATIAQFSQFAWIIPQAAFLGQALGSGGVLSIIFSLAVTAALVGLFCLIASKLYLKIALSMVNGASSHKVLSEDDMEKASAARSVSRTLFVRELKCYLREPAFITTWLLAALFPLIVCVPIALGGAGDALMSLIHDGFAGDGFGCIAACAILFGIALVVLNGSFNTVGTTCISREGAGFDFMKTIPVSYANQLIAKRNVVALIISLGSVPYLVVLCVVGPVLVNMPVWFSPLALLSSIVTLFLVSNLHVIYGVHHANLSWSNIQTLNKANGATVVIGLVVAMVALIGSMAVLIMSGFGIDDGMFQLICGAAGVLVLVLVAVFSYLTSKRNLPEAAIHIADL